MNSAAARSSAREFIVDIERILPGGFGLAHADDLTLFVPLTAPGDVVRVEVERVQRKIAFAVVREVIKPSQVRTEPPCPYFGRCGGCDFQQLTYEAQLNAKVEIISDCLHRIAKLKEVPQISIHPSPREWQYRSRTSWQLDPQQSKLGYFEAGSHRICDVEVCAVLIPELQSVLESLRGQMRDGLIESACRDLQAASGEGGISVAPSIGGYEDIEVGCRIGNEEYLFNADSFFQINHQIAAPLVEETLTGYSGELAIDLYCGVGLFTLPLARKFARVLGVESNSAAVRLAKRNLQRAQLQHGTVINSRVGEWLSNNPTLKNQVDLMLLDPPRTGAESTVIEGILKLRPKNVGYVSCDPATLARDLRKLMNAGYALESVAAYDMFPQTHHVETVARLHDSDFSSR